MGILRYGLGVALQKGTVPSTGTMVRRTVIPDISRGMHNLGPPQC